MSVLEKALQMLESHPLCDHCLGRQFAFLAYGIENEEKGKMLKTMLLMEAQAQAFEKKMESIRILKTLATNGFFKLAEETLRKMGKRPPKKAAKVCFLCEGCFETVDELAKRAVEKLGEYEFSTFMVGVELPVDVEEREDEFKARFDVEYGENMRLELGKLLSRKIAQHSGKKLDHHRPDIVVLLNPKTGEVRLQINPLYIAGRYKKLVRGIPQSKWICTRCRGNGCEKCNWTGKMYPESVEELISPPFLEATRGVKVSFHASGREDVDARMLGKGRPFVIEISQPKKRFLDLKKLEEAVNAYAEGKVEVSDLRVVDKSFIGKIKKGEAVQKEYRVIVEFEKEVFDEDLKMLEQKLTGVIVKQRTPLRVLHRRADLTREKYIYEVKVKRLSPNKAEIRVRCQGGLYVKELVSGDEGRTTPSVSEILGQKAKPIKLDVLNVIM
ncbi:MAG: tRNA pseudouridine(54/55) synthase Pus10 [Candidatus Bathyarchaeota archaeon]|nr:tRNA pseudouridine(54/55) synthase Pus10 [Candidatus Bathyarchaeota archaeon]